MPLELEDRAPRAEIRAPGDEYRGIELEAASLELITAPLELEAASLRLDMALLEPDIAPLEPDDSFLKLGSAPSKVDSSRPISLNEQIVTQSRSMLISLVIIELTCINSSSTA